MKKIVSLILVLMMALSITGCADVDFERYQEAYENMQNLENGMDASVKINLKLKNADEEINIPLDIAIKQENSAEASLKYLLSIYSEIPVEDLSKITGEEAVGLSGIAIFDASSYIENDCMYSSFIYAVDGNVIQSTRIKQELGEGESIGGIEISGFDPDAKINVSLLTIEDFTDIQREQVEGGGVKYTLSKTPEEIKAYLKSFVYALIDAMVMDDEAKAEAKATIDSSFEEFVINFDEFKFDFTIKDAYFTEMDFNISNLSMEIPNTEDDGEAEDGVEADDTASDYELSLNIKYTLNNPGEAVTVTPPHDLSGYKPLDEME